MKLIDIIETFISGDWGNESFTDEATVKVHCLRSADIVPIYQFDYENIPYRYVSQRSYELRELHEGDIVIEKSGGTDICSTGRPIYVSKELLEKNTPLMCSNFCGAFRVKEGWSPLYIYYYIKLVHKNGIFFNFEGKTSGIHNLDIESAFKAIEIPEIPYSEQIRIASTIDDLDHKIYLNRLMNATLEKIAQQLYNYWFVQFDFPNAQGKPFKSSGGKMFYNNVVKREIPEGWEVKQLSDIAEVCNGATPSTSDESNYGGDIVWITPKDLSDQKSKFTFRGERTISEKGYSSCSTRLLPKGSILMSSRAPIGLLSIASCEMCTNQGFKSIIPKEEDDNLYLYFYLKTNMKQIEQLGSGTTFKEVSRESMNKYQVLYVNDRTVYAKWVELIKPIFAKQETLIKDSLNITSLRDYLLPLLLNEQVNVKE